MNVTQPDSQLFFPSVEKLMGKPVPLEIFEKILSYLNFIDLKQARLVNHFWDNKITVHVIRTNSSKIKSFADFLRENLSKESYASQRENLFNIGNDKKILNLVNLNQVKFSIQDLKVEILNILKDLK